jgi:hypothetical protein|mmetsp:Transcript_45318/g.102320  ORF Transcript_45318/g.102320 Transcript_45318/m.102320 type:complete len:267 (-) Transcript_45318:55-855(-)
MYLKPNRRIYSYLSSGTLTRLSPVTAVRASPRHTAGDDSVRSRHIRMRSMETLVCLATSSDTREPSNPWKHEARPPLDLRKSPHNQRVERVATGETGAPPPATRAHVHETAHILSPRPHANVSYSTRDLNGIRVDVRYATSYMMRDMMRQHHMGRRICPPCLLGTPAGVEACGAATLQQEGTISFRSLVLREPLRSCWRSFVAAHVADPPHPDGVGPRRSRIPGRCGAEHKRGSESRPSPPAAASHPTHVSASPVQESAGGAWLRP